MLAAKLLAGGGAETLYVDDVFSAYTYTGNGSTQTITNGIDLAGEGGMVWIKQRNQASSHRLFDTSRGVHNSLASNATAATASFSGYLTAFNSNGFSVGTGNDVNESGYPLVSLTFRKADKFYNHTTVVKSSGSNATVSFANLTTLGMVRVKRTDAAGSWYVWHRSLTSGKLLIGETTAAEATLGHITVSGTTVTLVNGVIADGTYLVEGFAHDTSADGLIQCGSYVGNGSSTGTAVTLGWEPQLVEIKVISAVGDWNLYDTMRGFTAGGACAILKTNSSSAESTLTRVRPTATGFQPVDGDGDVNANGSTYIYLAIRRPNKPPTTGTQVYNAIARTGTGAAATVTGVGFAPDLSLSANRDGYFGAGYLAVSRLQGAPLALKLNATDAEVSDTLGLTAFTMNGVTVGTDATRGSINAGGGTKQVTHFFKRAPGVFDVVCYAGTGSATTVSHGLGAVPELMIVRNRTNAGSHWVVYSSALANTEYLLLNSTAAKATVTTYWNSTTPIASVFSVGTASDVNQSATAHVAYLFATLAGVSKVGSYTGNGSSQTINCGFTTGARFFLVKATSTTGSWWVFDTTRGIVASTDFGLQLNSTAAETTSADAVDPDVSGIVVNQEATCSINANGVSYIFLALA